MNTFFIVIVAIIVFGIVIVFILKLALEMLKVTGGALFNLTTSAKELILNIGSSVVGLFQPPVQLNIPQELETHDAAAKL